MKELKAKLSELNKQFFEKDTPQNRIEMMREINNLRCQIAKKESEIASKFARELQNQELSYNEAISLLDKTKLIICESRFNIVHQD
jgi:hypothetical protein